MLDNRKEDFKVKYLLKREWVSMMDLVIKNGKVVTKNGLIETNIKINGEKIVSLKKTEDINGAENIIDATGKIILPGIIDSHVHMQLQDLGKIITTDTFETGTRAGAFGGVTTTINFADQTKGESATIAFDERKKIADESVCTDYGLHVSLTDSNYFHEIPELIKKGVTSFKIFTTYSWRNLYLNDAEIYQAFKIINDNNVLAVLHCENDALVQYLRENLVKEGKTDPKYHYDSRPNFVEAEAIQRLIILAKETNARIHIFHISTKEGVQSLADARTNYDKITGETCPHYIVLDKSAYKGPRGYLNLASPPLRNMDDVKILKEHIISKNIDTIVTDHCEFSRESKGNGKLPFHKVANGIPGIETNLPLMNDLLINNMKLSYQRLAELLSTNSAKIFGLYPQKGTITVGSDADLVIFDPKIEKKITPEILHSNIDWNPYDGKIVKGWVDKTILRGKIIVDNEEFLGKKGEGKYLKRVKPFDNLS